MVEIELTDAVAAVREELLKAAMHQAGQEIEFTLGPIEMEFAIELRIDAKAGARATAWVLMSAEEKAGAWRGPVHRVKVTLTPTQRGSGASLEISGPPPGPDFPIAR